MEKRAFIAVLLMFLVLVVFEMVMRPGPRPIPEGEIPGAREEARPEESVSPTAPVPALPQPESERSQAEPVARRPVDESPEIPEKEVRVKTDLIEAVISTRGPTIVSWKLNAFEGVDADWVDLVPDGESEGIVIGPQGWEESAWDRATFEVNTERLVLTERNPTGSITFVGRGPDGGSITETLRFTSSSYLVEVDLAVESAGVERGDGMQLGWISSMPSTEPDVKDAKRYFAAMVSVDSEVFKNDVGKLKKEPSRLRRGAVHWAGIKNKYFAMVLVPESGSATAVEIGGEREAERLSFSVLFPARASGGWNVNAQIYGGPIDYQILKDLGLGLEKMVDFGHKIIRPLSKLIYWMLLNMHRWLPNYGVVIIILSTLTKVLFYPLTQKSMKSMQSMQELQPKMAALKEKYKNDPKRMNQEVMKLYKEQGVNPLGGCLPLLLQSPVFFALYAVLQRTIELRRAPFVLWIDDLSRPDVIFSLPSPLPAISVLPILMGASMFLQQRLSSSGGDPRQKMLGYMMPIFLTVIFFRMPSGLVLYWLVNTVLSIGQQYILKRKSAGPDALEPAS